MNAQTLSALLVGCAFAQAAGAHHSFAMFDQSKCEVLAGQVVKFQLAYPHAWLWVMTSNAEGKSETWGFEGADPTSLRLRGWSNSTVKAGDKVQVSYSPLRDGRLGGSLAKLRLPDGQVLAGPNAGFKGGLKICDFPDEAGG